MGSRSSDAATDTKTPIEKVLEKQDRSITWLAGRTDVSVSYAWMMIRGQRPLTVEFRRAAADALGVPAEILFPVATAEATS